MDGLFIRRDPARLRDEIQAAVRALGVEARARLAVYPPETEGNLPGPYPQSWYQRHHGPRWARKDGSVGGRNTSEQLQKSWKLEPYRAIGIRVFTDVTYAAYVQGDDQAAVHAAHGWQTTRDVAETMARRAEPVLRAALERAIRP